MRLDGFISVHASYEQGEFVSKLLKFAGNRLELSISTSGASGVRVEILDAQGNPFPGFSLEECESIYGDTIQQQVKWKERPDLGALASQSVRLRFVMNEADLYSLRFGKE